MNFRNILPGITLVVGLVLGLLGARVGSQDSKQSSQDSPTPTKSAPSSRGGSVPEPRESLGGSIPVTRSSPEAGSYQGDLDSLLNKLDFSWSSTPPSEFLIIIENLQPTQISLLIDELEGSSTNDPRVSRTREALFKSWATLDPVAALAKAESLTNPNIKSFMFGTVAAVIAKSDPEAAKRLALDMKKGNNRDQVLQKISSILSLSDPEAAISLMEEAGSNANYIYSQIFSNWTRNNPSVAIAAAQNIKDSNRRYQALNGIASYLATEDPDAGWNFALELKGNQRQSTLSQIISQIGYRDPTKALDLLDTLPKGQEHTQVMGRFASYWVQYDTDAAIAWMADLPNSEKYSALQQSIWSIAQADPEKAATLVSSMPTGSRNSNLYSNLVNQWAQSDPEAAQTWLESLPPGQARDQARQSFVSQLSQNDPTLAAKFIENAPLTQNTGNEVGRIAGNWAQNDPEAAFTWLDSLELNNQAYKEAINNTITQLADSDVDKAARYTLELEDEATRKGAIKSLLGSWANQDLAGAKSWITTNLSNEEQSNALKSLIQSTSYQNPRESLELIDEMSRDLSPEELQKELGNSIRQVANGLARNDPTAAAEWVLSLPSDESQKQSIGNVISQWANYDNEGAANFVLSLEEGNVRDAAATSLINNLQHEDPEAAFLWADSINDPDKRDNLIKKTIRNWKNTDSDAARQALQDTNVSEGTRTLLLKALDEE